MVEIFAQKLYELSRGAVFWDQFWAILGSAVFLKISAEPLILSGFGFARDFFSARPLLCLWPFLADFFGSGILGYPGLGCFFRKFWPNLGFARDFCSAHSLFCLWPFLAEFVWGPILGDPGLGCFSTAWASHGM